jgi:hypothetical protein
MPVFDYLGVVISIVLGLALTQVLGIFGHLMKHRRSIVLYWPYLLWTSVLFFTIVQVWWGMWHWRSIAQFRFFSFLYLALGPMVMLYLLSVIVVPDFGEGKRIDLESHYLQNRRSFFVLFVVFYLLIITGAVLIRGQDIVSPENGLRLGMVAAPALCTVTTSRRIHVAAALGYAVAFFVFQAMYRSCIGNC